MYGPVRTVVWQGSVGDRRPYADQQNGHCSDLVTEHVAPGFAADADKSHRLVDIGRERDVAELSSEIVFHMSGRFCPKIEAQSST